MFRFFAVIVSLVLFTTDSFAACSAGYYEESVDFTAPTGVGHSSDSYGYYCHDGKNKSNYTSPVKLSAGQWHITWTKGLVKGTAVGESSCNGTSGSTSPAPSDSMSNSANGRYCWCKVTQSIPNSGSSQNLTAAWVFADMHPSARDCASYCARSCPVGISGNSLFMSAVFGTVTSATTCTACPDGGTSTGTGGITNCYIPSTTNFTDSKGTYHFSSNCYYSN